jgi:hypothetical protein
MSGTTKILCNTAGGFPPPRAPGYRPPIDSPLHTSTSWRDEQHQQQMQQQGSVAKPGT